MIPPQLPGASPPAKMSYRMLMCPKKGLSHGFKCWAPFAFTSTHGQPRLCQLGLGWHCLTIIFCRGVLNSYGVFQTYYKLDFLSLQSTSTIGWIRSLQGVLFFAVSIIVGPMFDLGYFRSLTWVGTAFSVVGMFLLSISSQFYQMLLTQSVLVGIGEGCLFLPAPAVVAQHFNTHLGLAVSIASVGSAVGRFRPLNISSLT